MTHLNANPCKRLQVVTFWLSGCRVLTGQEEVPWHTGARASRPRSVAIPDTLPVLLSEPVAWEVEYRCFVLVRRATTSSPYLRDGRQVRDEGGAWVSPPEEHADAVWPSPRRRRGRVPRSAEVAGTGPTPSPWP